MPALTNLRAWQLQFHDGTPHRFISCREATFLIERGDAVRIKRRKAHQPFEVVRLPKPVQPSDSKASACSLTVADMKIIAGETPCGVFYLELLTEKIEYFKPMTLAIRVMDSWAGADLTLMSLRRFGTAAALQAC